MIELTPDGFLPCDDGHELFDAIMDDSEYLNAPRWYSGEPRPRLRCVLCGDRPQREDGVRTLNELLDVHAEVCPTLTDVLAHRVPLEWALAQAGVS